MTNEQIASTLHRFETKLDAEFAKVNTRLDALEKHSVTKSDVHMAVFQGLAFAAAAIVGTVVVLRAVGLF
ncbi:MAG: hypothetical protein AAFU55_12020 [Pseudomonadota bacterium]